MWASILAGLKAIIATLESDAMNFWHDIEAAFPAASQAAIADMAPLALSIVSDLNNQAGLNGKQIASEALAQLETALMNAGKDFIIAEATGAIAIAMGKSGTQTASGNGGVLQGGNQTPPTT